MSKTITSGTVTATSGQQPDESTSKTASGNGEAPSLNPLVTSDLANLLKGMVGPTESPEPPAEPAPSHEDAEPASPPEGEPAQKPAETESDLSNPEDADEELPRNVAKRLHKQAEKYEARLKEMQAKLDELTSQPPAQTRTQTGASPIETITDPSKLAELKPKLMDVLDWCDENPDGGTLDGQELNHDQVKDMRKRARRVLNVEIPGREKFLAEYAQQHTFVKTVFAPHLDQPDHEEAAAIKAVAEALPGLRNRPDWEYWALAAIRGHQALQQQAAAKAKKPASKPPPPTAGAPTVVPRKPREGDDLNDLRKRAFKDGDGDAVTEVIRRSLQGLV